MNDCVRAFHQYDPRLQRAVGPLVLAAMRLFHAKYCSCTPARLLARARARVSGEGPLTFFVLCAVRAARDQPNRESILAPTRANAERIVTFVSLLSATERDLLGVGAQAQLLQLKTEME